MTATGRKIKLVVGINDFRVGGAQKVVTDIVSKMNTDDFEINLITLSQSPDEASFYESIPSSIVVHKLSFKSFYDISSWLDLYQLLKSIKPDVVWSHLYFSNTVFRVLKPLFRYRVITVEHNTYVNRTFAQKFVDRYLSFVTYKIVAVSDYVADFTASNEHISRKKFITILNGVDVTNYRNRASAVDIINIKQNLGFSPEDKIIISVGQLIKQKNHILLIEAFAEFVATHQGYKLIILGEGRMRGELEDSIHKHSLGHCVKLLGIQKDTPSYYAISEFFVLPSLFEGFALVCIEAMACGLPVLTTRVAGPDTYISENKDGLFFEPTTRELIDKLRVIADMPEVHKSKMKANAMEKANEYDIHSTVIKYEAIIKESLRIG